MMIRFLAGLVFFPRFDMPSVRGFLSSVFLIALCISARAAEQGVTLTVDKTYDGRPFTYQVRPHGSGLGYRVLRFTYPSPIVTDLAQNNTIPAEYYLPAGADEKTRRPAVVCLHILNGNFELERITCSVLASQGIAAAMIMLPYYGERGTADGPRLLAKNPQLFRGALEQGIHDVRRTIDLLASRAEVDPQAIGLVGISMGGISAAAVAEREPRVARAALILAGGDLDYIIHHTHETKELSDRLRGLPAAERQAFTDALNEYDPLRHADQLRGRAQQGRVLMVNASEDQVIDPACTRKLAAALGIAEQVRWLEGLGHYSAIAALPQTLETVAEFFAQDLAPAARPPKQKPVAAKLGPLDAVGRLLGQVALLAGADPQPGRGHLVDLQGTVMQRKDQPIQVRLRLIRGSGGRFRLEAKAPVVGEVAVGQAAYPWILARGNTVFKGRLAQGQTAPRIEQFIEPRHLAELQLVSGMVSGMAVAPQIIEQLVTVKEVVGPALQLATKDTRRQREGLLKLRADRVTPERLELSGDGVRIEIAFRQWQFNTVIPDQLFLEPPSAACREVEAVDIVRMCAAAFNFAMEEVP